MAFPTSLLRIICHIGNPTTLLDKAIAYIIAYIFASLKLVLFKNPKFVGLLTHPIEE